MESAEDRDHQWLNELRVRARKFDGLDAHDYHCAVFMLVLELLETEVPGSTEAITARLHDGAPQPLNLHLQLADASLRARLARARGQKVH